MLTLLVCLFGITLLAIATLCVFAVDVTLAIFPGVLYILLVIGVIVWIDRKWGGKK